jgi:hypothetical protein
MAVRVRLSDGILLLVQSDLEGFTKLYQEALRDNELLEVENGNGRMRVLNPQQILYFEDATGELSEDDREAAEQAAPLRRELAEPR